MRVSIRESASDDYLRALVIIWFLRTLCSAASNCDAVQHYAVVLLFHSVGSTFSIVMTSSSVF